MTVSPSSRPDPFRRFDLEQLRRRTSMKWQNYPADVLPCWVAEMDVEIAEPVVEAVTEAMRTGDTGYPAGTAYAEALAEFAASRWGWDLDPGRCTLVPDVMRGSVELLGLFSAPGDSVVVNSPVYPPFFEYVELSGRKVVPAPLAPSGRLDFNALEDAFRRATADEGAAGFLLCSPHNPTGVVHTADELTEVARLAREHGIRVIADEIHAPLVAAGTEFVPYLSAPGTEDAFALLSASKAWNLPGLKAAVAVAGPEAAEELARIPGEVALGASHVGVIAHVAALREGLDWLDRVLAGLDRNRALLAELLTEHLPTVRHTPAEATYLAWLDCRGLGLGDDPAATFLRRGRVALNSGPAFGRGGEGFARLNLATSPELITEAVRRMASAVE